MACLLTISALFALIALVLLAKAALHTWHIEVLRHERKD